MWLILEAVGFNLAFGLVPLLLLYFPEGRRADGVHTLLARATVLFIALSTLAWMIRDGQALSDGTPLPNPLAPPVLGGMADAATGPLAVGLVLCGLAAIGDAAVSYRRSVGVERLQRRWFVLVAVSLPVMLWAGVLVAEAPVRRRVQSLVDRRFNRSRYDAQRLVDGVGVRVRGELDLVDLRADLGRVIGATVQPAHLSMWMAGPGSERHP